jgi:hypothetical protein
MPLLHRPTVSKRNTFFLFLGVVLIFGALFFAQKIIHSKNEDLNLPIPYTTQAPDGNWDNNENCEEADLVMTNAYLHGNHSSLLNPKDVQSEIKRTLDWENINLGHSANTGSEEIARMAKEIYNLDAKILNDYSEDDLKNALQKHDPVILTLRGQALGNPNYIEPGPPYHVILLRGYNSKGFISNDPGTNDGKNYVYSFAILKNASVDWDSSKNSIDPSKKPAILISK